MTSHVGRSYRRRWALRRVLILLATAGLVASVCAVAVAPPASGAPASCGSGDPATDAGTCTVTIDPRDFASGDPLAAFNYIVNVDNSKLPDDPLALNSESFSPIVRTGNQARDQITLPDGRYLISVRSRDHKLWGEYITLPEDADDRAKLPRHV